MSEASVCVLQAQMEVEQEAMRQELSSADGNGNDDAVAKHTAVNVSAEYLPSIESGVLKPNRHNAPMHRKAPR
jgi:hypothetical protein